jgi:hypothetical protein
MVLLSRCNGLLAAGCWLRVYDIWVFVEDETLITFCYYSPVLNPGRQNERRVVTFGVVCGQMSSTIHIILVLHQARARNDTDRTSDPSDVGHQGRMLHAPALLYSYSACTSTLYI